MAGLKEIRRRIQSVSNTKQITRAMKLVSAAKLRRAQEGAQNGRDFGRHLSEVVGTLLANLPAHFSDPLTEKREVVRRRRIVMIGGERGLCGGYNANLLKAVIAAEVEKDVEIDFVPLGRRAVGTAKRLGWNVWREHEGLPEDAARWPIAELGDDLIQAFRSGECDEVVVYFTEFVSALTQRVKREVILPLAAVGASESTNPVVAIPGLTSFDTQPEEMLRSVIPLLVRTHLRQAALEAKASEHAARMTAMDAATNNANDLIDRLRLFYNRARQTTITRELIDIVGGAEAIR